MKRIRPDGDASETFAARRSLWWLTYLGRDCRVGPFGARLLRMLLEETGTGRSPESADDEPERGIVAALGALGLAGQDPDGSCWAILPDPSDRETWRLLGLAALDLATGAAETEASRVTFDRLALRAAGRSPNIALVPFGSFGPAYSDEELDELLETSGLETANGSARMLALAVPGATGRRFGAIGAHGPRDTDPRGPRRGRSGRGARKGKGKRRGARR